MMRCLSVVLLCAASALAQPGPFYVSPQGDDANHGTAEAPVRSIMGVIAGFSGTRDFPLEIRLMSGTYYLPDPIVLSDADSNLHIRPADGATVTLSAGRRLEGLAWEAYRDGIVMTQVPEGAAFDDLFVNGELQHMARYPNYDANASHYHGFAPDAISPARVATWSNPVGGFLHVLHGSEWGGFHYRITGKSADNTLTLEGGYQNNRPSKMHDKYRFVENIFEELDAPHEWYFDAQKRMLYYYPEHIEDLKNAVIEVSGSDRVIAIKGVGAEPVKKITIEGVRFAHTRRTFMETREPVLRSDWAIARTGAVFIEGAEDVTIKDCTFDHVGGNAVFVSGYARHVNVEHCIIDGAGASGVCFVGKPEAVRDPLFQYSQRNKFADADRTPGPKSDAYPADCTVSDTLMHGFGRVEKQVAGVEIDIASRITVSHCSIYDCPRAGINIGDGCFGGHVIEFCDVFDTVKETGDHGAFNSWGRDRYWHLGGAPGGEWPALAKLDAVETNTLRYNRFRCDHGWDIDLDDGSSNYLIQSNVCLSGGIKLREGFYRTVENNVMVNCTFHPHVWYEHSHDVFTRNIVQEAYKPIQIRFWGDRVDRNLLPDQAALDKSHEWGVDEHSLAGDPMFRDASHGDFRVAVESNAVKMGFVNFPMDQFGVTSADLKVLAKTPIEGGAPAAAQVVDQTPSKFLGATIKKLVGLGERSATGLDSERGVLVMSVPGTSLAAQVGLKDGDVILMVDDADVNSPEELRRACANSKEKKADLRLWRDQAETSIRITLRH